VLACALTGGAEEEVVADSDVCVGVLLLLGDEEGTFPDELEETGEGAT